MVSLVLLKFFFSVFKLYVLYLIATESFVFLVISIGRRQPMVSNSASASLIASQQVARMYQRLSRAHSHEGVTQDSYYPFHLNTLDNSDDRNT